MQPQKVERSDIIWGVNALKLMPPYAEIPSEFKTHHNKWVRMVETWFYKGLDITALKCKPEVNRDDAIANLKTIMRSFEPQHEHKIACVAYLMSQWFE